MFHIIFVLSFYTLDGVQGTARVVTGPFREILQFWIHAY